MSRRSPGRHMRVGRRCSWTTLGIHHFQPFTHGVDVSIQAATKYLAGTRRADRSITVNNDADWQDPACGRRHWAVCSPDDCWLTLRGIRTMAVRLQAQMDSGLQVATGCGNSPR